jgi:hypothetical protein
LAGQLLGNSQWIDAALDILRGAALVRTMEAAGVVDAGLCHGVTGNAHLFNRVFQATGVPILAEAARYWYGVALDLRRPGRGVGGYQAWTTPRAKLAPASPERPAAAEWISEVRWLTGASGVGLALLAASSPLEPRWDRLMAISG